MPAIDANGITIEYEEHGKKENPVILLINGLGRQLIEWPDEFCRGLVEHGFRLVLFDNRDVGLSTKFEEAGVPNLAEVVVMKSQGLTPAIPYTLYDMAADTLGLIDALKIDSAHILGLSMGGMIAQIAAAQNRNRAKSLTCIISSSGNPELPAAKPEVTQKMMDVPRVTDRDAWFSYYFELFTMIGTPGTDPDELKKRIKPAVERSLYPQGTGRQIAAIYENGSRVDLLRTIEAPTLAISGSLDPLLPPDCGRDIAANVRGARFELIEGMGHDLPVIFIPHIVDLIVKHLKSAGRN